MIALGEERVEIALQYPVHFGSRVIDRVSVRIPKPSAFRGRPRSVSLETWNLATMTGLTPKIAGEIDMSDMSVIVREFEALAERTKRLANSITAAGRL